MNSMRWLSVIIISLCQCAAFADVTITRTDAVIEHRVFDPKNPPAEMPALAANEAAVTESFFAAESRVGGSVIDQQKSDNGCRASIKIDTVQMTLKLRITVWLPSGAVPKIVNHEEGHRAIAEKFYEHADVAAKKWADAMIGETISASGNDCASAGEAATKRAADSLGTKYMGTVDVPCAKAQEIYDQITAHGTNAIKEEKAIREAIERVQ
jgi:hypothetical protein